MSKTSIEWTDHAINPLRARRKVAERGKGDWRGRGHYCEKISAGCTHCYSSRFQPRFGMPEFGAGQHRDQVELYIDDETLVEPLRRRKPTKYFVCDMTDLFGEWVPDEFIDRVWAMMLLAPQHTFQVLTKRAERMRTYLTTPGLYDRVLAAANAIRFNGTAPARLCSVGIANPTTMPARWIWLGVSVENQEQADARIPEQLRTPAAARFLSIEPLLGPVDLARYVRPGGLVVLEGNDGALHWPGESGIEHMGGTWLRGPDWVIVGGESGPGARPMHPAWPRHLRDQCTEAGVAYFFKQWGAWAPGEHVPDSRKYPTQHFFDGRWEDCDDEWSTEKDYGPIMYRVGKKAAGRLLDGVEWHQFPEVQSRQ